MRPHLVFVPDYDINVVEQLTQGVDVWINNPRRPFEASGTSGMKVLVNGGLNLSELDGWWAEAYEPGLGWAIGDGREHGSDPAWDRHEAEQVYNLTVASSVRPQLTDARFRPPLRDIQASHPAARRPRALRPHSH